MICGKCEIMSQKSQFHFVEKIKNKNKKHTRASLFQSSEDGKQETSLSGLMGPLKKRSCVK